MISQWKMKEMSKKTQTKQMMTRIKWTQLMNVKAYKKVYPLNVNHITNVLVFVGVLVLHEIQERMDWLEEMEKLGEGHKYKGLIKSEIEERLRSIKRLQPTSNPSH